MRISVLFQRLYCFNDLTLNLNLQEYKTFLSQAPVENSRVANNTQTTLDGHLSAGEKSNAKPYSYTDGVQQRLVDDVLSCFAETMIPLRALEKKSFDQLAKLLDPRAVVSPTVSYVLASVFTHVV